MIPFQQFEKCINALKAQLEKDDGINKALGISRDYIEFSEPVFSEFLNFLEYVCKDTECSWISYWMFDLDFGTKYKEGSVKIGEENVKLESIVDLYNLVKANYEN